MKKLLIGLLALGSISAFANICTFQTSSSFPLNESLAVQVESTLLDKGFEKALDGESPDFIINYSSSVYHKNQGQYRVKDDIFERLSIKLSERWSAKALIKDPSDGFVLSRSSRRGLPNLGIPSKSMERSIVLKTIRTLPNCDKLK